MANSDKTILFYENGVLCSLALSDNCGLTVEEIQAKDVPDVLTSYIVNTSDLPTDYTFRDAWTYTP